MFDGDVSVGDEQLNSIVEDDSLLDSNGDIMSGQRSPPQSVKTKNKDTTITNAAASSKAEEAEPAKENSLPTNPHSKQGGVPARSPFTKHPRRTASDRDDISRMKDKIESSEQCH